MVNSKSNESTETAFGIHKLLLTSLLSSWVSCPLPGQVSGFHCNEQKEEITSLPRFTLKSIKDNQSNARGELTVRAKVS